MRKLVLVVVMAALFALTACSNPGEPMEFIQPAPTADAQRFTLEDLNLGGVIIGESTSDEVISAWGAPESESKVADDQGLILQYGFGQAYFNNSSGTYRLNDVTILAEGLDGPRGVRIGDEHYKVIAMFPNELQQNFTEQGGYAYLYAGEVILDENGQETAFLEPFCNFSVDAYGSGGLNATGTLPENGMERKFFWSAYFTNGKISKMAVNYGTPPIEKQ